MMSMIELVSIIEQIFQNHIHFSRRYRASRGIYVFAFLFGNKGMISWHCALFFRQCGFAQRFSKVSFCIHICIHTMTKGNIQKHF